MRVLGNRLAYGGAFLVSLRYILMIVYICGAVGEMEKSPICLSIQRTPRKLQEETENTAAACFIYEDVSTMISSHGILSISIHT